MNISKIFEIISVGDDGKNSSRNFRIFVDFQKFCSTFWNIKKLQKFQVYRESYEINGVF
jgi:hypothetical protein